MQHRILIVGGGFGGIKAAQDLSRMKLPDVSIKLIDPKLFLNYHAAVYRLVTGRSAAEVCIPYSELLKGVHAEHVRDAARDINLQEQVVTGTSGSRYAYDTLILAVGGEASYFGLKGIEKHSYGIDSVEQALRLKNHVHEAFSRAKSLPQSVRTQALRFVIIGGGASGVEMAGELATYTRMLARTHDVDPSLVTIDLVEARSELLPSMPDRVSHKVEKRLRELGVNILLNRSVQDGDDDELFLQDTQMKTETIVWTAGLKANDLLMRLEGLQLDSRGRAVVDSSLRATGHKNVFVIGDAAATTYSGMAQTALADAAYVARAVASKLRRKPLPPYRQPAPAYAVPAGPGWAAVQYHGMLFFGRVGWFLRRAADFRAFLSLLPLGAAIRAFRGGMRQAERG